MFDREIDGCTIDLILERRVVRWGDEIRGRCQFRGGSQPGRVAHVELRLHLPTVERQAPTLEPAPIRWWDIEVPAGQVIERPFELPVPARAGLGSGAAVVLSARGPGAWLGTSRWEPLTLVPERCFTDVLELATAVTGFIPGDWHSGQLGDAVRIRLTPPEGSKPRVEAALLDLLRSNGFLHGHLIVIPVPKGIGGALRRFAALDPVHLPIRFREGDLDEAARQLVEQLRPYLDETRQFPIPALPAAEPDVLPIPARAEDPTPDALPRPALPPGEGRSAT